MKYIDMNLNTLSLEEKILIAAIFSTLFHFTITFFLVVVVTIILLWKKRVGLIISNNKYFKFISILVIGNMLVSLFHLNHLGLIFSVFVYLVYINGCYIKTIINKNQIDLIMEILSKGSILVFAYTIIGEIINRFVISFGITNYSRILFLNENYAATVYTFIALISIYLFDKKNEKKYIFIILMNLYLIYQSYSRGALIAVVFGIALYMLIANRRKVIKYRYYILNFAILCFIYLLLSTFKIVPGIKLGVVYKYLTYRVGIWQTAYLAFLQYPIFGYGQFSHLTYCNVYGTMCIIHAHNIYLELLVTYGIVGVSIIGYLSVKKIQNIIQIIKIDKRLFSLVLCCLVATLLHGLVDYQIFWIQPGLLFVFLVVIPEILLKEQC